MKTFDYPTFAGLLYIAMIAYTIVYTAVHHDDYSAGFLLLISVVWPLFWLFKGLILIFDYHDKQSAAKHQGQVEIKSEQIPSTQQRKADAYIKDKRRQGNINTIRGGRIPATKIPNEKSS